ncbi:MAG: hypothetical protein H6Q73_3229, partial [Firmicutes bacterium]|nr:hypothetical protein [Bacillota bacterium]
DNTVSVTTGTVTITTSGALSVTGSVNVDNTVSVTIGTVTITTSGALSVTGSVNVDNTVSVTIGTVTITTSGALSVTGSVTADNATTDVTALNLTTSDTTFSASDTWTVLPFNVWTVGAYNASTTNSAGLILQVSPDGTNYLNEEPEITLPAASLSAFVSTYHFKYARMYYRATTSGSTVTLNLYLQGHA